MIPIARTPPALRTASAPAEAECPDLAGMSERDLATTFGRLFDDHAGALYRYLAARVGPTVAEDIVGDTFLVALRDRTTYDPARASVRPWLFGIATNLLRRHMRTEVRALRATARVVQQADAEDAHADRVTDQVDAASRVRELAGALAQLSEADRDVLLLTSWSDLNATEVADALGIPSGTVRSRLHRVRRWLRSHTTPWEEPDE